MFGGRISPPLHGGKTLVTMQISLGRCIHIFCVTDKDEYHTVEVLRIHDLEITLTRKQMAHRVGRILAVHHLAAFLSHLSFAMLVPNYGRGPSGVLAATTVKGLNDFSLGLLTVILY